MTTAELLLQDYDMEMQMTRKLLDRVPDDRPDFKCHEKSAALGKLTMHVATLPFFGKTILTTPSLDMADTSTKWPDQTFSTREHAIAIFSQAAQECRAALAACSDATLGEHWRFSFGDHVISDDLRSLAYRHMFFNHFIHHRAQLSVYLRLNEIPVPGLYGPSADEPFGK